MKKILFTLALALIFSGCTSIKLEKAVADSNDPKVVKAFEAKMTEAVNIIDADSSYVRIPLDTTKEINWFTSLTFIYWDGKISREEYIAQGLQRYPDYAKSLNRVADLTRP